MGLFTRFVKHNPRLVKNLGQNAYGIYLVHYVFLIWTQWALLPLEWNALIKATIVFMTVLSVSCALTKILRQSSAIRRAL